MNRFMLLVVIVWLALGARLLLEGALRTEREPLPPRIPLSELPWDLFGEGWTSEDLPISERTIKIAGVSDYVYRRFTAGRQVLVLWVGYVMRSPLEGLHYPEVCFPLQGFQLQSRGSVDVPGTGMPSEPRFAETTWNMDSSNVYCLFSFYYPGRFAPEPFSLRVWERVSHPNYYAVVALWGNFEGPKETIARGRYLEALRKAIPSLLDHFPEEPSG